METNFLSNCCNAFIVQADQQGHGKCSDCGENCVPEEPDTTEEIYHIPDLSWQTVLAIATAVFLIDAIQNFYWSFYERAIP